MPEHSRSRIRTWIDAGRVSVSGETAAAKRKLYGGERIVVAPLPPIRRRPRCVAQALPLAIVYEDDALIVVDKPAGLVVHPGSGNWDGTLANALLHHAPQLAGGRRAPASCIGSTRIPAACSSVAKTPTAQTDLVRQLQARSVRREYLALVARRDRARRPHRRAARPPPGASAPRWPSSPRASPPSPITRCASASPLARCCRAASKPAARIRSACTWRRCGHPACRRSHLRPPARRSRFARQALHAWRLALAHPVHARRRCSGSRPCPTTSRRCCACFAPAHDGATARWRRAWPRLDSTGSFPTGRRRPRVRALSTTRNGRAGASFDLARGQPRSNAARAELRRWLPADPVWLTQVHGAAICDADAARAGRKCRPAGGRRVLLRVAPASSARCSSADCLPVLFMRSPGQRRRRRACRLAGACGGRARGRAGRDAHCAGRRLRLAGPGHRARARSRSAPMCSPRIAPATRARRMLCAAPSRANGSPICMPWRGGGCAAPASTAIHGGGRCTVNEPARLLFLPPRRPAAGRMATLIWLAAA